MSKVSCPICEKEMNRTDAEKRREYPFCSQRCRLIDLKRWLDGDYRLPSEDDPDALDDQELDRP